MAKTVTSTSTFARLLLLKMQIRTVLRRTTAISEHTLDKLMVGVENRWIEKVMIYGFGTDRLCRAELVLKIDWEEHNVQLALGKVEVTVDQQKWLSNTAIEVDECVRAFRGFVEKYKLKTDWRITLVNEVLGNERKLRDVRKKLGTSKADSLKWAGKRLGEIVEISELPELQAGFYMST